MNTYSIGDAAKRAGVTARAARLYEAKGLLLAPDRSASGYRIFDDDAVETLAFIGRARSLGLSLGAIAEIIDISAQGPPCEQTRALLDQRVADIDAKIRDLTELRATIVAAQQIDCAQPAIRCAMIERTASADLGVS